jgi:hypothetical protein
MAGNHTARQISPFKRQAIALALSQGFGVVKIARSLKTSEHIVHAVRDQDWHDIARRKEILLAQAEHNALVAGEQIGEALEARKFPPGSLAVVYGISVDKSVALRPTDTPTSAHLHLHLQPSDIAGTFNSFLHNLQAKARTLPDTPHEQPSP